MKFALTWLRGLFLCHELWALRSSIKWPFFSVIILGTLNLWWILPNIPLSILGAWLFANGHVFATIVVGAIGLVVGLPTFTRVFEWYFMAVGLMLGTGATARKRCAELEKL